MGYEQPYLESLHVIMIIGVSIFRASHKQIGTYPCSLFSVSSKCTEEITLLLEFIHSSSNLSIVLPDPAPLTKNF